MIVGLGERFIERIGTEGLNCCWIIEDYPLFLNGSILFLIKYLYNQKFIRKDIIMKNLNILITHVSYQASAGSFIKLLRNSCKYHFYIVGCDSIEIGFSSGSLLVDKFYHIKNNYPENYINEIRKIIINEKINVIISAEEEDLIKFKDYQIKQAMYEYIPSKHIFELFKDKYFATKEIGKLGIYIPHNIMTFNEFMDSNSHQFIRRKRISCCSRGITIFDKSEITSKYVFFSDEYMTQEFTDV